MNTLLINQFKGLVVDESLDIYGDGEEIGDSEGHGNGGFKRRLLNGLRKM